MIAELPNLGTLLQRARVGAAEMEASFPSADRPSSTRRQAVTGVRALEQFCRDTISRERSRDRSARRGSWDTGHNDSQDGNVVTAEDIGDNLSTVESRWRGNIVVHVPRVANSSPLDQPDALERGATGTWAGSVAYDGARNIAWVLAEALRMYERENPPLLRNGGLARKPQLVPRPAGQRDIAAGGGQGAVSSSGRTGRSMAMIIWCD